MSTNDDLSDYTYAIVLDFKLRPVSHIYETYEIKFLDVMTDISTFQIANHNEHNGYYGGFDIVAIFCLKQRAIITIKNYNKTLVVETGLMVTMRNVAKCDKEEYGNYELFNFIFS